MGNNIVPEINLDDFYKDADQIITWASSNDNNLDELEKAIIEKKAENQ